MNLLIDDWWEMLTVGLLMLAAVALMLRAIGALLRRGGKIKAGPLEAGGKEEEPMCPPIIEHTALLADLKAGQDKILETLERLMKRVEQNDFATGALIDQAGIMQKFVRRELGRTREGEEINGDLDDVDEIIGMAKSQYRDGRKLT